MSQVKTAILTLCVSSLLSCGFDEESLPEVQLPEVHPSPFREAVEMPLHGISLALAAEYGDLAKIEELHDTSTEIDWPEDGARAAKLAARGGQEDAVRLLLAYGVCDEPSEVCAAAIAEAESRQYTRIVALFRSSPPFR